MAKFAEYGEDCKKLLERGLGNFEEAIVYAKNEKESAKQKVKDGIEDVRAVTGSIRTVIAVEKKGLQLDVTNLENSYNALTRFIKELVKTKTGKNVLKIAKEEGLDFKV